MATSIDALKLARALADRFGQRPWFAPVPFGDDGWIFQSRDQKRSLIATCADYPDDPTNWIHASLTGIDGVPTYGELKMVHQAIWGNGWAYQVFAPPKFHVNIHSRALHLFGRADGKPALPDFTMGRGII